MNTEEKKQKLEHMQKYFVTSFWISFVLLLISSLMCILMNDYQIAIATKYFHTNAKDLGMIVLFILGLWKILIIQFTLIPALAIWYLRKCCKCECKS